MKILVAGRRGQVAQSLVERAAAFPQFDLIAIGRPEGDLTRPEAFFQLVKDLRPAVVINAAAYTAVDQAEGDPATSLVNRDGARSLAEAAKRVGASFIHLSTDYVFDGSGDVARDESAPTAPLCAYGRSKLAGEEAVQNADPNALILRTAWVYSPFGLNFVRTMMKAAAERDELRVVSDQRGNPTSALDLADAILVAARAGESGLFHLAGTGSASWAEFAEAIMGECGRLGLPAAKIVPIATRDYPTLARRPMNSILDSSRFAKRFGFVMPDWRSSLRPVVERLAGG